MNLNLFDLFDPLTLSVVESRALMSDRKILVEVVRAAVPLAVFVVSAGFQQAWWAPYLAFGSLSLLAYVILGPITVRSWQWGRARLAARRETRRHRAELAAAIPVANRLLALVRAEFGPNAAHESISNALNQLTMNIPNESLHVAVIERQLALAQVPVLELAPERIYTEEQLKIAIGLINSVVDSCLGRIEFVAWACPFGSKAETINKLIHFTSDFTAKYDSLARELQEKAPWAPGLKLHHRKALIRIPEFKE